ncbi:MAG: CDP-glycerol glycerophosphotransferase family protein [Actinomycetota bacterium]|nr:CDP-glycerol glycerophosphotransferase family protein [Actinomycetota bacterium]
MRIVYNSYNGRYSDSPRAVHRALLHRADAAEYEHVWLCDPDHAATFPLGTLTKQIYTPEGVAALESADLVVSNGHLEMDWHKRPGATYLQTWHGTPLKRIHADVLWGPEGLLEQLSLDVERWDLLLSPNTWSTEVLRRAFRWPGEVLETGYPRNDVLGSADAPVVRREMRRRLGIDDGRTAVLYAPTWRDDVFWEGGQRAAELALDVERFAAELGEDHVLLLRLHYKLTGRLRAPRHPALLDVSAHPEVADLYLAADVMVTDYSSTMFDFAVTGKPLLFFTYDLERYRDELRGFYFDLTADPPGPVVRTTEQLLFCLRELDCLRSRYAEAYARFRRRFCPLDDGRATERVLDRVLRYGGTGL